MKLKKIALPLLAQNRPACLNSLNEALTNFEQNFGILSRREQLSWLLSVAIIIWAHPWEFKQWISSGPRLQSVPLSPQPRFVQFDLWQVNKRE